MHLPLYILFVLLSIADGAQAESLTQGFLLASLILTAIVFLICIANIILSILSIFKGETDLSKTVMKVKLALIPWYVVNFLMGVLIVAIFFNPFLMIGIPVAVGILAGTAYFCMLSTSLPDVAYYIRRVFIKREEERTARRVFTVIFLFIFCLDVLGAILFRFQNKKASPMSIAESETGEIE